MYCHNCGFETESDDCPKCGTTVIKSESTIVKSWRKETDFKKIAKHPDVIDFIYEFSKLSNEKISSQYILDKVDLVFGTFTGISTNLIMEVVAPIFSKLGINTGKKDEFIYDLSINEVFVKTLCSISANKKLDFKEFHQAKDGLLIISKIKPDLLTYKGTLAITLIEKDNKITVMLNAAINGQFYDYGKCKRIISKVLTEIKSIELN